MIPAPSSKCPCSDCPHEIDHIPCPMPGNCDQDKCPICFLHCLTPEQAAAQAREDALKPISVIYERFKHLDAILSKRDPDCPMMLCYVDIWEAVKESLRTEAPK